MGTAPMKVSFDDTPQPGDGTGSSIEDAMVRNEKGLCAIQNCGSPLAASSKCYAFGNICLTHAKIFNKMAE